MFIDSEIIFWHVNIRPSDWWWAAGRNQGVVNGNEKTVKYDWKVSDKCAWKTAVTVWYRLWCDGKRTRQTSVVVVVVGKCSTQKIVHFVYQICTILSEINTAASGRWKCTSFIAMWCSWFSPIFTQPMGNKKSAQCIKNDMDIPLNCRHGCQSTTTLTF